MDLNPVAESITFILVAEIIIKLSKIFKKLACGGGQCAELIMGVQSLQKSV